jgi:anion-transporting  ArsA/GET3 family ATPase
MLEPNGDRPLKLVSVTPTSPVDALLEHRIVFVAGKGGSGKTALSAALALKAAREGKCVLAIEADAKGDLFRALGSGPGGYEAEVVQRNLSVLSLKPELAMQEYLHVSLKIPRIVRATPLSRVFDFIATGIPGPKEMVTIGKIAYEERATNRDGDPKWDLIIVDAMASGQVVSHLRAPRDGLGLMQAGLIKGQLEWLDKVLRDRKITAVALTATPEEMSVVEAIELDEGIRQVGVAVSLCFANKVVEAGGDEASKVGRQMNKRANREAVSAHLGGPIDIVVNAHGFVADIENAQRSHIVALRADVKAPVVEIPLVANKPGLATTRVIAAALSSQE